MENVKINAMKNRLKFRESTLCNYTTTAEEIKEGDILGYGDNYPCVVVYNKWEAKFELIEFGYKDEGYLFRHHEILSQTTKWEILGNIDDDPHLLKDMPEKFDYNEYIAKYYNF